MANIELLVEVGEFASGILEEEPPPDGECSSKQINKQDSEEDENRVSVGVEQNRLIASQELQLVHQPKSIAEQNNDGEKESVGDHFIPLG